MKQKDWVTWGAMGIGALILVVILFIPPFIGVANNGDFERIVGSGGIAPLSDKFTYEQKYFGYSHSHYEYGPFSVNYWSSQALFVFLAGLLGRAWSSASFPLEAMGAIYAALLLAALFLIVRHACSGQRWLQLTVALCLLFIFFDIAYVAYFQSFFGEPVSLIFLLLGSGTSFVLASRRKPSIGWLVLFFVSVLILSASKLQNAPIGLVFILFAFRLYRKRPERSWRSTVIAGSASILAVSALVYAYAPQGLKQINLYQTIFYGILKDSPHVKRDLAELGIPEKFAVLAGTNYFQKDVPIRQDDPELTEHVYSRLGHADVAAYYIRHPGRMIDKLEAASSQAAMIRPYYLGNYEQEAGKPRGALSYTYSVWSETKKDLLPQRFAFNLVFFLLYIGVALREYTRRRYGKHVVDAALVIGFVAIIAVAVPLVGDGEADLGKHLFLFNVSFDMMIIVSLVWVIAQIRRIFDRSPELH
ncbi:hypothetical protein WJ0W_000245 [Paenibacillus melissococcoides]|uniref:Glycosyltransferase RgtA/B/C/D-like domain-containing protein n=1 Tax=Paenibacillus melissococcoides TaxID=2912268 RepID=A0ABN8TWD4_9BACL|nr:MULTISPECIES: hypothetical protein [Paenibacillus]MEB9892225.1 hypothetical protein [Bacillus cereus]CAH8243036.1 hypothetical protein WJ0W_000245 [Paenibacillus melissococcoides]CAH8703626.1 hypothetical protein WDD9_000241 [Paenibacillus melissococcoides]CAH8706601.1 hypothetical protein HTL2_001325 [Paenibacillus melissococcoides]GIO79123.1 membrane protein [Paenibacillus dendritiformis]